MSLAKNDSQDCFTLIFVNHCETSSAEEGVTNEVQINTEKGKALSELLEPILLSRGKSFESHSLFLESSTNPLPLNGESFNYAGAILYVKERVSTCKKTRFAETLEQYRTRASENDLTIEELNVEEKWQDLITETDEMSDKLKAQQNSIWELLRSEAEFIKDLQSVIQVFQNSSKMIQDGGCMTEVDGGSVFSNIVEIYEVNVTFWRRLKNVVDEAKAIDQPISPNRLIEAFTGFEQLFQPYIPFCNADSLNLKSSTTPTTPEPTEQYIQWCDAQGTCKRITMNGFLMKPLRRVTRYSILLKNILEKTEDDDVRSIFEDATSRIERFVSKINKYVHLRQEKEKLNSVVNRFAAYNPVNLNNDETEQILKEFCTLNLKGAIPGLSENENRLILKEGPMKLLEKQGKKEVYGFLFSDVFVIAKMKKNLDKYCIHRPLYRLNKIRLEELKDPGQLLFIYLNEYGVVTDAFVLFVKGNDQPKWKSAFMTAKENYELARTKYAFKLRCWDDETLSSSLIADDISLKIQKQLSKSSANSIDFKERSSIPILAKPLKSNLSDNAERNDVTDSSVNVEKQEPVDASMLIFGAFFLLALNIIVTSLIRLING